MPATTSQWRATSRPRQPASTNERLLVARPGPGASLSAADLRVDAGPGGGAPDPLAALPQFSQDLSPLGRALAGHRGVRPRHAVDRTADSVRGKPYLVLRHRGPGIADRGFVRRQVRHEELALIRLAGEAAA